MVVFTLDGLEVFFPYDFVYPEQYEYMKAVKQSLDQRGHCVLEMPTGTGKTVSLFSLITSYQYAHPEMGKLVYCTRTVPEMEKALEELKIVVEHRQSVLESRAGGCSDTVGKRPGGALAIGLSARRNMCINPAVSQEPDREVVDQKCRSLTAKFKVKVVDGVGSIEWDPVTGAVPPQPTSAPAAASSSSSSCGCVYYENLQLADGTRVVPDDVYTIEDLKRAGVTADRPFCPYYASRRLVHTADVVVLNYQYVLDPRVAAASLLMGKGLGASAGSSKKDGSADVSLSEAPPAVVVFDEGHNIDNVCVEALSVTLTRECLEKASRGLRKIEDLMSREQQATERLISDEYRRLVEGLRADGRVDNQTAESLMQQQQENPTTSDDPTDDADVDYQLFSPLLSSDAQRVAAERMPGSIRKVTHFLAMLRRVLTAFKSYIRKFEVASEGPLSFLLKIEEDARVDQRSLRHVHERFKSLLNTLQLSPFGELQKLAQVCDFVTLLATYCEGFIVIVDPYPEATGLWDPVLQLHCLDSALAMRPVLQRFRSVVLTSATLSPLNLYPKLLGFDPVVAKSLEMSLDRECILPIVVAKGADQSAISSRFDQRDDGGVIRNYGALVLGMAESVPDGVVVFFTSYAYMDSVVSKWYSMGVLASLAQHKLIFMESPTDVVATTLALNNYRRACDSGRGAIFLSVARGRVSEGIDFDRHYGRAVLLLGVPFQYVLARGLKARLDFLRVRHEIEEQAFLSFDAMRQASQCLGRVIRSKADYGIMIMADQRYGRTDKLEKLPQWVRSRMNPSLINVTADTAVSQSKAFLKRMAQPFNFGSSKTRLDLEQLRMLEQADKQMGGFERLDNINNNAASSIIGKSANGQVGMGSTRTAGTAAALPGAEGDKEGEKQKFGGEVENDDGERFEVGHGPTAASMELDQQAEPEAKRQAMGQPPQQPQPSGDNFGGLVNPKTEPTW